MIERIIEIYFLLQMELEWLLAALLVAHSLKIMVLVRQCLTFCQDLGNLVIDQPIKRRKFSMISLSYISVVALTLLWISENLFIIILARIVTMVASEIKYLAYSTYVIEVVGPDWRALTGNRFLSARLTFESGIQRPLI